MRQPALFLVCFIFLSLLIGFNLYYSNRHFGELVYPLDDAYIHMAISKNLQQHGVWGVTRFEFSSTSSSILYTLLLSGSFALIGIKTWLPLAINWILAGAILWLGIRICLRFMNARTSLIFILTMVAMVPVSGMVVLGMEHSLQIFLCTLFLWLTYRKWNGEAVNNFIYACVSFLAVATRYESVFIIGLAGAAWLLIYRDWKQVLILAVASVLPVLIFGLYALSQGGYFVPNSLLAKSNYVNSGIKGFIDEVSTKILFNSMLAALIFLPLAYWLIFPVRTMMDLKKNSAHLIMAVIGLTAIVHQVFASFGWMFRYEAYLVSLVFLGLIITWQDWKTYFSQRIILSKMLILVFGAVMLFPIITRIQIPVFTNRAMKNIHDQQLQMARFVEQNFSNSGIAMNDIGTTCFLNNEIHLFDMEGLGTLDVLKMKKQFDSTWLKDYAIKHQIDIGIFYPHLYVGKIPSSWEQLGSWTIRDRFVSAGSEVGFFAINPAAKERLITALQNYRSKLPGDMIQKGAYLR